MGFNGGWVRGKDGFAVEEKIGFHAWIDIWSVAEGLLFSNITDPHQSRCSTNIKKISTTTDVELPTS
ncbi:hypothetical protein MTR_8g020745 [Medicago truncatula]|uniref:Uncharacterized protein n=1 Tax=Medicago truncatula TaxID=3880 RepID=A0A072TM44_MEDTR|nr:hypothetical protein MTR_8g020745 [Medicago truncatula]